MASDYQGYLATEIVSEQNTITYRNLSRALKVHCNSAKCMLFEFHQKENKKRTGSVYATYLLAGTKKIQHIHGHDAPKTTNGDVPMPSSPPLPPSSMPVASQATELLTESSQTPVKTILLCREDDLEAVKTQFEKITSIHIYSLSPGRIPDLQSLTDNGRGIFADYHAQQDPLIHNKDYGIIQNPHVRRRKGKRPLNVTAPQPKVLPPQEEKRGSTIKQESKKEDTSASRPSSRDSTTTQETTSKGKPTLKRDASSLFKAFAKQGNKPKLERQDTSASAASSTDAKMGGMDDEEGQSEDEAIFLDTGTTKSKKRPADVKKEKEERQAKLRKMMEDEEDEETEVPKVEDAIEDSEVIPAAVSGKDPVAPSGDADNVDWSDSETENKNQKDEAPTEPKRRRGRRKVMKKRTMKDDEGFLVTREEEAWESFSEDEPVPVKKPVVAAPETAAPLKSSSQKSSAPKSSAPAAKKKDIMSFFGKK